MTGMAKASKLHKNPGYRKCIIPQKYKKPWYCFENDKARGLITHLHCVIAPFHKFVLLILYQIFYRRDAHFWLFPFLLICLEKNSSPKGWVSVLLFPV